MGGNTGVEIAGVSVWSISGSIGNVHGMVGTSSAESEGKVISKKGKLVCANLRMDLTSRAVGTDLSVAVEAGMDLDSTEHNAAAAAVASDVAVFM